VGWFVVLVEELDQGAAAVQLAGEGLMQAVDVAFGDLDVARRELVIVVVSVVAGEDGNGGFALVECVLDEGERVDSISGNGVGSGDGERPLQAGLAPAAGVGKGV
jgi:hypothetical protein